MKDFTYEKIKNINSVQSSKNDNYIRINVCLLSGENPSFVAEYNQYCNWLKNNKKSYKNIFSDFIKEFMLKSQKIDDINEIIDKDGNLYPDDDMPNNATNSMVGSSKFDLNKVYKQSVPKNRRFYNGYMGTGSITW